MRNLRLLLLAAAVAALGSYTAFAGAGSTPVPGPSVTGSQRTDAGEAASSSVQAQEGESRQGREGR